MKKRTVFGLLSILLITLSATAEPVHAQQTQGTFNVVYKVDLSQHFSVYGSSIDTVQFIVAGDLAPSKVKTVVSVNFEFNFRTVAGLPSSSNYTVAVVHQHPLVTRLAVNLPAGTTSFRFMIRGTIIGTTLAYRGATTIPYARVEMSAPPYSPSTYNVLIPTSTRFEIVSVFPGTGPGLTTQYANINGTDYLVTGFSYAACFVYACSAQVGPNTISIIYEPQYFNYFIAAYLLFAVAALVGVGLVFRSRRQLRLGVLERGKRLALYLFRSADSKKLLAALVIVSVLMVSLALVFGPSPAPRAYLAATPDTASILGPKITAAGYIYLTPLQAGDEFDAMSALGTYDTVIIADYPPFLQSQGLLSSGSIVVVPQYANATLVKYLQAYFGQRVTTVNSLADLQYTLFLQKNNYASNHLGLPVPQGAYSAVATVEGVLSLTIPFLALAFFARYMIESSSKGVVRLAQGAAFSFFVFLFGELVFIQTDVLLTLPVALHASISPQETALGVLGFGGGSRPRMVMGGLGFLFGAFSGSMKGSRIDRVILLGALAAALFLLADPLQAGQDFYNILLNVTTKEGGTAFGQAAYVGIRGFVLYFMNLFGNEIVPTYFSQHGAVLFFAGAIPFALYTYVRRSTATLLLLYSAAVAAVGYVRIGDQDPLKAIASTTPGFAMAVVFIILFLASDRVERFLRLRLGLA